MPTIGYKKCVYLDGVNNTKCSFKPAIVTLEIPDDADVVQPYITTFREPMYTSITEKSSKLRCSKAKVLRVEDAKTGKDISYAFSVQNLYSSVLDVHHGFSNVANQIMVYKVGNVVIPDYFDKDVYKPCSNGIHFFQTKEEALAFNF